MKAFSLAILVTATTALSPALAQETAGGPLRLKARVINTAVKGGRPTDIFVLSGNGNNVQYVETIDSQEILNQPVGGFKTLYLIETEDFVNAQVAMDNRKYADARAKFAKVESKYAATLPIKDSLSARAVVAQLECAVRLMDWAGVKDLLNKPTLKASSKLSAADAANLEVARIMALIADKDWANLKTKASGYLTLHKDATMTQKARLNYALGAVSLSEGKNLPEALDYFTKALAYLHGSDDILGSACVMRGLDAYLKMPEVAEFLSQEVVKALTASRANNPEAVLPDSTMSLRPQNVQEGAALYKIGSLMFPSKPLPEKYLPFAVCYKQPVVAPAKAAAPAEAPKAQPAAAPAAPAEAPKK